jgi:hypothetical protein
MSSKYQTIFESMEYVQLSSKSLICYDPIVQFRLNTTPATHNLNPRATLYKFHKDDFEVHIRT